jgi:predicted acyltransferase
MRSNTDRVSTDRPANRQAERQGRRLMRPAPPFLALASCLAVAGIVLIIVAWGWAWALGIVLVALAGPPAAIGIGLAAAGAVTRWAARDKPFA